MNGRIEQAVVLAAGMGTRIRGEAQLLPKPLVRVGGLPLIKRTLLTARKAGVTRFVVVVGCDGDRVRGTVVDDPDLADLDVTFVVNEDYRLKNGVSVLKAREHVRGEFLLMMSDHVVDPAIYETLQGTPARDGLVLAVDRKLDTIFDMDDATKVLVGERDRILDIGKEIPEYDAIDTGVFRCSPAIFEALQVVLDETGDASLSDGVKLLATKGRARVADVGAAWWQDVDDLPTREHAETLLFRSLTKQIDGPVSRHVNRRFSKVITRWVMNTEIVPNHMTAVGLIIGLASAVLTAMTTADSLWMLPLGGVLYQISSMIDGCDGEIARLKFKHSDWGEWFDTVSDDVINLGYQLALGVAIARLTGVTAWLHVGIATFVLGWVVCLSLYRKLLQTGKGTHLAIEWSYLDAGAQTSWFQRFCAKLEFVARRDFYALLLMFVSFMGVGPLKVVLVCSFVTVAIVAVQYFSTAVRTAAEGRRATQTQRG